MKKIFLVDVSSLFFRAFYAIRPLTSPSGLPVNAIYGFLSMVIKMFKEEKPQYVVFCYDRKEPSFRHEMYKEYKAHRTEMPDELALQIPYIKRLADELGIPSLEVPSFEADDIIGTLTELALKNKFEVVIVSGDKDFGQLVRPHVILWDTMKDTRIDTEGVIQKWGVAPEKFIDYLALVGDSSDNIPGVTGIGPKGAVKLLEQFDSIEDLYNRLDEVAAPKLREKIAGARDMAFLSKKLVTIEKSVPVDSQMESYHRRPLQEESLRELLRELNFKSFEKSLLDENVLSHEALSPLKKSEKPKEEISAEPDKEAPPGSELSGESNNESFPVLKKIQGSWRELLERVDDQEELWVHQLESGMGFHQKDWVFFLSEEEKPPLEICNFHWCGFDLKKIWHALKLPLDFKCRVTWDGMLAAYVVRAGDTSNFLRVVQDSLFVSLSEMSSWDEIFFQQKKLKEFLIEKLKSTQSLRIVEKIEWPLIPVLYRMEKRGIRLDLPYLSQFSEELGREIKILEKKIHEAAGESFNVASPKQLAVILFQKLGLTSVKKTKTGESTDNEVLEKLDHPLARFVLDYRELAKLKSTYVDSLPPLVDPSTQRVHTSFNQALTATGRLSSVNPNLQNIPIRTEKGQRVRKAFVADPGHVLLSADYSQIELRLLAHITQDRNLTSAFIQDLDIHTATAAEIFSVKLEDVTADLRRTAKAVNFGIAYGQGAFGLAEVLGIPRGKAQEIIKKYFEKFPGVKEYMESTVKWAYEKAYVETLDGRRRYLPEIQSKNPALRKFGERAAINAPIQGAASDLVKKAMIELDQKISFPMILQVHDELIFEGPLVEIEKQVGEIKKIMENVVRLTVPLKVNANWGHNWDESH